MAVNTIESKEKNKAERFERALNSLDQAFPYAKTLYQDEVFQAAAGLSNSVEGMRTLYGLAEQFDRAGIFQDRPWEQPSKLQPSLVNGSIQVKGIQSTIEVLSELRMLSIAKGKHQHENVSAQMAKDFLYEVMALNLDFLFPDNKDDKKTKEVKKAEKLFQFLAEELTLSAISGTLVRELNRMTIQRPIMVNHIISMIKKTRQMLVDYEVEQEDREAIEYYIAAISQPSKLSQEHPQLQDYRHIIEQADDEILQDEARTFAAYMRQTGLVSSHHTVLVRVLNVAEKTELLSMAMGLNDKGAANLKEHFALVKELIKVAIHPPTRQTLYGLARMLERGVLSSTPVIPGLRRLMDLELQSDVRQMLLEWLGRDQGLTANNIMVAGTISILGQPLGVGQGLNPTCQTARAISLWSLHAPGYLLELIPRAARDGDIHMMFEGVEIHSKDLVGGLVSELNIEKLDPISIILVPHLDRIYAEMIRRVQFRGEDAHKWVNPAFYGNWVSRGFSSVFDPVNNGSIVDYPGFVRLFYSTHHPKYNGRHEIIYPNPVGIFITNVFKKMLGFHAITIQRIEQYSGEEYRVYFYNPNNDSSQNWGQDIKPSVQGHDERPGESSLPFHQFVSRLYAFHYNPYEQGDAYAIEDEIVQKITSLAQESWGQEYNWVN